MTAGDRRIVETQHARYQRLRDGGHAEYVKRAREQERFYLGDQWDPQVRALLEYEERPALTLNKIRPRVNQVVDEAMERRAVVRFLPAAGGDQDTADALTKLWLHVARRNRLEQIERQVFETALVMDGRGYFDVRVAFDRNILGEVLVTAVAPYDVLPDDGASSPDPRDWRDLFLRAVMTLDEIMTAYPEKAKEVRVRAQQSAEGIGGGAELDQWDRERTFGGESNPQASWDLGAAEERRYLVLERQHRMPRRTWRALDPHSGEETAPPARMSEDELAAWAAESRLVLFETKSDVWWRTITCGDVVLSDGPLPYDGPTVVPFWACWHVGRPYGLVQDLMDPQRSLNKTASQTDAVVNQTANGGWLVPEGSLVDMDVDELERKGSKTGLVIHYKAVAGAPAPQKIAPNPMPAGLAGIGETMQFHLDDIAGVFPSRRGSLPGGSPEDPGDAAERSGTAFRREVFENFRSARLNVAEKVLDVVRHWYTEARVVSVALDDGTMERIGLNQPDGDRIANDVTAGRYDVSIETMPDRETFDEMQFHDLMEMKKLGVAIPDWEIVVRSRLADREALAEQMKELAGAGEPTDEEMERAQVMEDAQTQALALQLQEQAAANDKLVAETELAYAKADEARSKKDVANLREIGETLRRSMDVGLRERLSETSVGKELELGRISAGAKMGEAAMDAAARRSVAEIAAEKKESGR